MFKNTECLQISALEKLDLPIAGGYCLQQTSSPNLEPKEDNKTTESPSKKRRPSAEHPWGNAQRGMTSASLTGDSRLWSWRQQVVVMATAGCGHGSHGDSRLWSWRQQVVVMRLSTSHNRLNADMFKKMKLAASPTCNCGLEDQTAQHILQRGPLLRTARANVWPAAVQVYTQLYGSKEELEKTATFILRTGLAVQQRSRRRKT